MIVSLIFFIINETQFKAKIENLLMIVLSLIRNIIQLLRLINFRKNQMSVKVKILKFNLNILYLIEKYRGNN